MEYILLTQEQATQNKGIKRGQIEFNYATTLDGRYVCSKNSLDNFSDILVNVEFLTLDNSDFPIPADPYN
jgi:hypothetical protein